MSEANELPCYVCRMRGQKPQPTVHRCAGDPAPASTLLKCSIRLCEKHAQSVLRVGALCPDCFERQVSVVAAMLEKAAKPVSFKPKVEVPGQPWQTSLF